MTSTCFKNAAVLGPLVLLGLTGLSCSRSSRPQTEQSKPAPSAQTSPAPPAPANPPQARAAIALAPPLAAPPPDAQPPVRILRSGHTNDVDAVAFSPDRRWLASGSYDKTIRIWELSTGRTLRTLTGHTDDVWSLSFSPDGKRLASASQDGTVKVWDTNSWDTLYALNSSETFTDVLFGSDNQILVVVRGAREEGGGSVIEVHDATRGNKLHEITLDWNRPYPLVVTPNGRILSSGGGGEDGDVDIATKVWDLKTEQEIKSLPISAQAISSDGHQIASAEFKREGGKITLYNADTGKPVRTIVASDPYVGHLTFTPDGTRLLAALGNGSVSGTGSTIEIWDTVTGKELETLRGEKNSDLHALAISADGKLLAAGNYYGYSTEIWDLSTARLVRTLGGQSFAGFVAFDRDGHLLLSTEAGLQIWDVSSGNQVGDVPGVGAGGNLLFSSDRRWLVSNPKGVVKAWDTTTWSPASISPPDSAYVWYVGFAGSRPAAAIASSGVKSWQVGNGTNAAWLLGFTYAMAISSNGKLLAVGHARGGDVEIWDPTTATKLATFSAHKLSVNKLEFSPDGKFLLTAGQETPITPAMISSHKLNFETGVKLWDVSNWSERQSISFTGLGGSAGFSPDGRMLLLSSGPGLMQLFDLSQGKATKTLATADYSGGNLAFSSDGSWLAGVTQHGIAVWNITSTRQ